MKNVALLSTAYSGSTLVSMLVCSHPNVIGFGDTYNYQFVDLQDTACTCGAKPSVSCPVRVYVETRMKQTGFDFTWLRSNPTPIPGFLRSSRAAADASRRSALVRLYRQVPTSVRLKVFSRYYSENLRYLEVLGEIQGKTHYFDGCKILPRLELLRTVCPETKVVHLIKNPKAYLHSFLKRRTKDYRAVIDGWLRYHTDARKFQELLGADRYMLMTFEEFTKSPEDLAQEIYGFIGVPPRQDPFDQWVRRESVHVIGSRTKDSFRQVEKKAPSWKSELPIEQLEYVDRKVAGVQWLQALLTRLDWE